MEGNNVYGINLNEMKGGEIEGNEERKIHLIEDWAILNKSYIRIKFDDGFNISYTQIQVWYQSTNSHAHSTYKIFIWTLLQFV